jgi:cyclic pyranopterin phosphate synthase
MTLPPVFLERSGYGKLFLKTGELASMFMDKLIDSYSREINYLRISVTDRCNLRCVYCMPDAGIQQKPHSRILSFEQIYRIAKASCALGVSKVRITGGEPLVRKDLPRLIEKLKTIEGLNELALTTNGIYLGEYAFLLKKSGLERINISLDSLAPEKFEMITRGGRLGAALEGIESSLSAGLTPLKINVVLLKGFNTDEIPAFVNLTRERPIQVRFIEYMPTGLNYASYDELFFSCQEAKNICKDMGGLISIKRNVIETAETFRIKDFCGTIGFISALSKPFCDTCNKLRLTADGFLKSCLHSPKHINLKEALDEGISEENLKKLIKEAAALKPRSHNLMDYASSVSGAENFSMCQIGG